MGTEMSGMERKQEALKRREEFVRKKENIDMTITESNYKTMNVKTRKQLEEERELYIKNAVERIQQEALNLSMRVKTEEEKRIEQLKLEEARILQEEKMRAEAMLRAEQEREKREKERQEELRKQTARQTK